MTDNTVVVEPIQISKTSNGITIITIDRRHCRNAVDTPTALKLHDAITAFESDATQKVCVLHGTNNTFCTGFDLAEASTMNDKSVDEMATRVREHNIGPMGPSRLALKKPLIAAVTGYAVAGGLELSLLADMRVADEDAVFGVFCRRWGVPLIDGGTVRLQAIVGLGRAMDMILTGRPVSAREALSMGLANRVVPRGQAVSEAIKIAESLLKFPQQCLLVDRLNCYYSAYNASSVDDALRHEFETGKHVITKEAVQGAGKFSQGAGRHGDFTL